MFPCDTCLKKHQPTTQIRPFPPASSLPALETGKGDHGSRSLARPEAGCQISWSWSNHPKNGQNSKILKNGSNHQCSYHVTTRFAHNSSMMTFVLLTLSTSQRVSWETLNNNPGNSSKKQNNTNKNHETVNQLLSQTSYWGQHSISIIAYSNTGWVSQLVYESDPSWQSWWAERMEPTGCPWCRCGNLKFRQPGGLC